MRDWNAYAEHFREPTGTDACSVFVGADIMLELLEEREEILWAMVDVAKNGDLCEYCARKPDFAKCESSDLLCYDCKHTCVCKDCHDFAGFVWAGSRPEPAPEITVEDETPADPASARWTIAMLAGGSVMPIGISERPGLEQLQTMVGGYIETIEFRAPGRGLRFVAVFDEEGKLKNLPENVRATESLAPVADYLAGTVLILKVEGENIVGLTASETADLMGLLGEEWEAQV